MKKRLNINIKFPILELLPDVELYQCSIQDIISASSENARKVFNLGKHQ